MGRVIEDRVKGEFYPLVGLRTIGSYVKGKIVEFGKTPKNNPVVTLELLDLSETASTQKSLGKNNYEEVEVSLGDKVQVIGAVKDLQDKFTRLDEKTGLPFLRIGDVVTIKHVENIKVTKGTMQKFLVEVDE